MKKAFKNNMIDRGTIMKHVSTNKIIPIVGAMALVFGIYSPAKAYQATQNRSSLLVQLSQCRNVAEASDRLACYDRAAAALDQGEQAGEVVVLERSQVQAARRDLFGFSMPSLPTLFSRDGANDELSSIETTLTGASQLGDGKWIFRLGDGSEWRQIDSMPVRFRNRPDEAVRVRNAALGSFLLTVGNSRAVRVRRQ